MNPVAHLIAYAEERFPVNRLVALATVFIFVPLAASFSAYAAKHFPGLPVPSNATIVSGFALGATAAISIGYKFLSNWGAHEHRQWSTVVGVVERAHELQKERLRLESQERVAAIQATESVHAAHELDPITVVPLVPLPAEPSGTPPPTV